MHPLLNDISGLSDEQIDKKRSELSTRMMHAQRRGNAAELYQLQLVFQSYENEWVARQQRMIDELREKGRDFTEQINIGK